MAAAYDPENPSNLVGQRCLHDGELREIAEAEMVGGQMQVRLAPATGDVTITIRSVPWDREDEQRALDREREARALCRGATPPP